MRLRIPAIVPLEHLANVLKLNGRVNSDDVQIDSKDYLAGTLQFLGFSSKRDGQVYRGLYIFDKVSDSDCEPFSFAENLPGLVMEPADTTPVIIDEGDEV